MNASKPSPDPDPNPLDDRARDTVYTELCHSLTAVGHPQELLFLARLVLLMSESIADVPTILRLIDAAKEGLAPALKAEP